MKTGRKDRIKNRLALALAAVVGLAALAVPAGALGYVNVERDASLRIQMPSVTEDDIAMREDLAENDVKIPVQLYKLADINIGGTYKVADSLAGSEFAGMVADVAAWQSSTSYWQEATASLLKTLYGDSEENKALVWPELEEGSEGYPEGTVPTVAAEAKVQEAYAGLLKYTVELTKEDYSALVNDEADGKIDQGLYLVVPQAVNSKRYAYTFTPFLLSVPMAAETPTAGNDPLDDGIAGPDGEDGWVYDYTATLKPQREKRVGQLLIEKELVRYNATFKGATFVFEVVATMPNAETEEPEEVYRNMFDLKFTGLGTQPLLVEDLPVGATVTVTEVYSGASYKLTVGEESQTVVIPAEDAAPDGVEWIPYPREAAEGTEQKTTARVYFKNDYDEGLKGGVSAHNEYTKSTVNGAEGWKAQNTDGATTPAEGGGEG